MCVYVTYTVQYVSYKLKRLLFIAYRPEKVLFNFCVSIEKACVHWTVIYYVVYGSKKKR